MKLYFEIADKDITTYVPFKKVLRMWRDGDKYFIVPSEGANERASKEDAERYLKWLMVAEVLG